MTVEKEAAELFGVCRLSSGDDVTLHAEAETVWSGQTNTGDALSFICGLF